MAVEGYTTSALIAALPNLSSLQIDNLISKNSSNWGLRYIKVHRSPRLAASCHPSVTTALTTLDVGRASSASNRPLRAAAFKPQRQCKVDRGWSSINIPPFPPSDRPTSLHLVVQLALDIIRHPVLDAFDAVSVKEQLVCRFHQFSYRLWRTKVEEKAMMT